MTTSRRSPWTRALALFLALLLAAPLQAQVRLPALGESASDDFSVGTERRTGEQIMREIRRDPDYLDDPVLLEYLQTIWQPLVAAARQRGDVQPEIDHQFAWESFLVRDRAVNAFALPGGYVGVNLGLIAITATPDELASVLAHELSHVTQRHIARSIGNSSRSSMISIAALILAILAASRTSNVDVANAALMTGQAAAIQGQLNFSRDMEREADRMGFGLLAPAGFGSAGMAAMFEKLDTSSRLNDNGAFPYLRSHPLTVERISEARSRALFAGPAGRMHPSLTHLLMQVRSRVLMDPDPQQLNRLQNQAGGVPGAPLRDRLAAAYGAALAASITRNHAQAERSAADALALATQASPREPEAERTLRLLQAQVRLARGDAKQALAALDAIDLEPRSRAPVLLRAQALLDLARQGGDPAPLRESTEFLQTWVADHPQDAAAWTLLSASAEAVGLKLRALRAGAESRAAIGDLNGAIDRLRAAQMAARSATGPDFIEASVIDARLRELQGQRRQLVLEARGGKAPKDPNEPPPQ